MAGVTAAKNQHQVFDVSLPESGPKCFDDDGRLKRTGKILCYLKVLFFFFFFLPRALLFKLSLLLMALFLSATMLQGLCGLQVRT